MLWLKTLTPVTSEGSRSGVNWIREKGDVERAGERLREHRLADAGEVLDDHVPLGDQAEDAEPERVGRRVDDPGEVRGEPLERLRRRRDGGGIPTSFHRRCLEQALDLVDDPGGDLLLRRARKLPLARPA